MDALDVLSRSAESCVRRCSRDTAKIRAPSASDTVTRPFLTAGLMKEPG